jgi:CheY-like chemotaxis protein
MQNAATTPMSRDEFLQILSESGLFAPDELSALALRRSELPDAKALAQHLESTDRLTPFQTKTLCERKFAELLIGNYEVLDRLGAGGMGTVFRARHRRMNRVVALKVMARELCRDPKSLQRFQREVQAVARLSHPNIVLAHDADEAAIGHFLVMEYVNGRDLATLVHQSGPFSVRDAVSCILQAALGLEYAHDQGIIHRDIKPANLLRDSQGVVKITDLGLARLNDVVGSTTAASSLTQAGGVLGTVDYMSPEQGFDPTSIDPRADIYSLGCTLYFLLTGAPPFTGSSVVTTLLKHRDSPVPALTAVRPDVPVALDSAFRMMMAKKPADRFQSMSQVLASLGHIVLPDTGPVRPGPAAPTDPGTLVASARPAPVRVPPPGAPGSDQTVAFAAVPVPPVTAQPAAAPAACPPPVAALPSVLVVEPSRTQAGIMRRYLQALGIEPLSSVATGQEAVAVIQQNRPDVVVSSMHLNDMTGVQLAQRLFAGNPKQAPGFLLICSLGADVGSLNQVGNARVLTKPFAFEKFTEALGALTHRELKPVPGSEAPVLPQIIGSGGFPVVSVPRAGSGGYPVVGGPPKGERAKLKVLIVDDSATARLHARGVLQGLGLAQFVDAENGAAAVALVVQEKFDLIVTDYNMPLMDGHGLLAFLRQNPATATVPVIMVTTETDPGKLDAVRHLATAVCDKSFRPEVVRPILDRLFGV